MFTLVCTLLAAGSLIAQDKKAFEGTVPEALALAPSAALLETDGEFDLAAALAPKGFDISADGGEHGNRRWRAQLRNGATSRHLLAACVEAGATVSRRSAARSPKDARAT